MTLVLASYHQQFHEFEQACQHYRAAAAVAAEAGAHPQAAQARMALASVLVRQQRLDEAAEEYEQAADAAEHGNSLLLRIENLRMAGTCHLQQGREEDARRCWHVAVTSGNLATPAEIRNSSLSQVGESLVKLLRDQRLEDQARSVEALLAATVNRGRTEAVKLRA